MMEYIVFVFFSLLFLVLFHHFIYPLAMMALAVLLPRKKYKLRRTPSKQSVRIVIPACNEETHIFKKLSSIAENVPIRGHMAVTVLDDGSTDGTASEVNRAIAEFPGLDITLISYSKNKGKMSRLNEYLPTIKEQVTVLTDSSALLGRYTIRKTVRYFSNNQLDVVAGGYGLSRHAPVEQKLYWKLQVLVKQGEDAIGALVGAHGACYAIRTNRFSALADTIINDDFVIPVEIILKGGKVVYDPSIQVYEAEVDDLKGDLKRRRRIGAGNAQQLVHLLPLLLKKVRSAEAFCCFFGKLLRVLVGPILILETILISYLGMTDANWVVPAILWLISYPAGFVGCRTSITFIRLPSKVFIYFLYGHMNSLVGAAQYLFGSSTGWRRLNSPQEKAPVASQLKRIADVVIAGVSLVFLAPVFPLVALWIKLDSSGPVIFKQRRVGRVLPDRTEIFYMYKFRSMRTDAERDGKPVWAKENDNRVTVVGRIIRKTRLDELPQLINVIRGDMSIVGPRPERPGFYKTLENAVPCFVERTYWVRPGITGLAQVEQGYTETVEEARTKALFDHVYAMKIHDVRSWIKTDIGIIINTVLVMALGRGR